MKKIKYISLLLIGFLIVSSCEKERISDLVADIENTMNLVAFEDASGAMTQIADGVEYSMTLKVKLVGPTTADVEDDLLVSIGVDTASTAIEGTHFRIETSEVTLSKDNNYLALVEFTMLTEGIETPLDVSPVVLLKVSDVSGSSDVIVSSKPMALTLNYACPSELAGTYTYVILANDSDLGDRYGTGGVMTVTETGVGTYRTSEVGHWAAAVLGNTPGFTFYDVCGVITVPDQDLVNFYDGNPVGGVEPGSVSEEGVINIVYKIGFGEGVENIYDLTLTPQ